MCRARSAEPWSPPACATPSSSPTRRQPEPAPPSAEQLHNRWPKLKGFIDAAHERGRARLPDVPAAAPTKLHSTNPLGVLNKEIKRRADVVGIFPNTRLDPASDRSRAVGGQHEWQLQHRYMQIEGMAGFTPSLLGRHPHMQFHLRPLTDGRSNSTRISTVIDGHDRAAACGKAVGKGPEPSVAMACPRESRWFAAA